MKNLNIRTLLGFGFGVLVLVVMSIGYVSLRQISELNRLASNVRVDVTKRDLTVRVQMNFERELAAMRGYLISGQEKYADANLASRHDFDSDLDKLDLLISTGRARELSAHLRDVSRTYSPNFDRAIELRRAGKTQAANDAIFNDQVSALRADLSSTIGSLVDWFDQQKQGAYDEQDRITSGAQRLITLQSLLGALIAILTSAGILILITRNMANLGKIVHVLRAVAHDDLSVPDLEVKAEDEIGMACRALNEMKHAVRAMVGKIAFTAEHLASASEELSSTASLQAQGAGAQSDQTSQIATAMQQMSATVLQVSDHSNQAATSSRQAADVARHGGEVVKAALAAMHEIATSVSASAKKVEDLGKSSDRIGQIIGVIDDIADQTNLLALNAAIEAARAGEQGRGFAVVADEVRKLAERTTQATKEVAQTIRTVQEETKTAVQAMEAGTRQVEGGVKTTSEAGEALREIISVSESVGEMITHIATAATEQSSASEEINGNMEQIARLVKQSADGAQQSAKACHDLSGLALDLQKMVGAFRISETEGQAGQRSEHARPAQPRKAHAAAAS